MVYPLKFGKYLLLERINVGGMAEVFKAKTFGVQGFERLLAIKRILPNMAEDDEFIKMFVDEARIVVQLSHSNVVQVYELGKYEEQYYIAMEFVLGKDLRQIFDRFRKVEKVFPVPAAAFVASKICDGLDYAHRKSDLGGALLKLVHRDVSPQNILVSYEGAVKITDFGIAKAEDRSSKTQAGVLKGKFGYMSPEQIRGAEIDHRSDIFALGILLYEMVTGERLFIGDSDFATLEKVRAAEVPSPTQYNPDIPEELERIMLKALARDREDRYQWASELHDDLQTFLIVDNRIYNGKSLAAMLQEEYREDIEQEKIKSKEYIGLSAREMKMEPDNFADKSVPGKPLAVEPPKILADTIDNDKTMIFESFADFASAETIIGPPLSELLPGVESSPKRSDAMEDTGKSRIRGSSASETSGVSPSPPQVTRSAERNIGPMILGVTVAVCALILFTVWKLVPSQNMGSVVITSTPISKIDVFLDDQLIGKSTPIERKDIAVGEHLVVGKAKGYADRVYSFQLAAGQPAYIEFRMEKIVEEAAPIRDDGKVQIVSSPSGAMVRSNGVSRGETPLTLFKMSRKRVNLIEISKEGFVTERRRIEFGEDESSKQIELKLVPVGGGIVVVPKEVDRRPDNGSTSPLTETSPPSSRSEVETGSVSPPVEERQVEAKSRGALDIVSSPSGAEVWVNGVVKGVTPFHAESILESGVSLTVEIRKAGYAQVKRILSPVDARDLELTESLSKLEVLKPPTLPKKPSQKPRKPAASACSGSGARLSVMPVGIPNCKVTVGGKSLGVAPFFKKGAPIGKCRVSVVCKDGRSYRVTKVLKAGKDAKLIIKPQDW